jgi:hypothetical protein
VNSKDLAFGWNLQFSKRISAEISPWGSQGEQKIYLEKGQSFLIENFFMTGFS